jgi:hypothetical protein
MLERRAKGVEQRVKARAADESERAGGGNAALAVFSDA